MRRAGQGGWFRRPPLSLATLIRLAVPTEPNYAAERAAMLRVIKD
jgi:hypothetical protein